MTFQYMWSVLVDADVASDSKHVSLSLKLDPPTVSLLNVRSSTCRRQLITFPTPGCTVEHGSTNIQTADHTPMYRCLQDLPPTRKQSLPLPCESQLRNRQRSSKIPASCVLASESATQSLSINTQTTQAPILLARSSNFCSLRRRISVRPLTW